MSANYFLSILWLNWKFRKKWFYKELIRNKGINLDWISLKWSNGGELVGSQSIRVKLEFCWKFMEK
jgi:predicted Rdx family selenoprotein